jgi:hypothetical protein
MVRNLCGKGLVIHALASVLSIVDNYTVAFFQIFLNGFTLQTTKLISSSCEGERER